MNFLFKDSHWAETQARGPHAQCVLGLPRPGHRTEPAWPGSGCGGDGTGRTARRMVCMRAKGSVRQRWLGGCVKGTRGGVLSILLWRGEIDRGGESMRPRGAHGRANARCIGMRKGRLHPGLNSVHARVRREEARLCPRLVSQCLAHGTRQLLV
jgi:hypothetical protein